MFDPKITEGRWAWHTDRYFEDEEGFYVIETNRSLFDVDPSGTVDEEDRRAIVAVPELLEVYKLARIALVDRNWEPKLIDAIRNLEERHKIPDKEKDHGR